VNWFAQSPPPEKNKLAWIPLLASVQAIVSIDPLGVAAIEGRTWADAVTLLATKMALPFPAASKIRKSMLPLFASGSSQATAEPVPSCVTFASVSFPNAKTTV
jgi:hypothetical protein